MSQKIRQIVLPLLAALIWGSAFVFQSVATDVIKPMTFTAGRSIVAVAALCPVIALSRIMRKKRGEEEKKTDFASLFKAGAFCGIFLSIGSVMQQEGLAYSSAGKAAFITALYIVIVPVCRALRGHKASVRLWQSVATAVLGLYFLSVKPGEFSVAAGDIILIIGAFGFAGQILMTGEFGDKCDSIELCCVQFVVSGVICTTGALIFESPEMSAISACAGSILYVGVMSSAVAFSLQTIAQKDTDPTIVSILLSLEAFFGAIAGALFLKETMSSREIVGCALMLTATVISQLPEKVKASSSSPEKTET